ncbi:MAG: type II toxin-antitoxin system RelE/ParE family toxin [Myxococcaceae bacterium]|nr:type II toxin-antitoxin system RelE/ParE family toxin [Myxococcaceae bacterium]MCI0669465.1 type II toxin-antitoxin system RelE/ParE family toxin [Myxococcaceae bacterium]
MRRATRFYDGEAPGLGEEFLAEVQRTFARLASTPELGAPTARGARRVLLHRFPYAVIYQIEPERVLVLAVGHQRRHPDFWVRRG